MFYCERVNTKNTVIEYVTKVGQNKNWTLFLIREYMQVNALCYLG